MVWILAISAATTRRAIWNSSSSRDLRRGDRLVRRARIAEAGIGVRVLAPPSCGTRRRWRCARARRRCGRSSSRPTSCRGRRPLPVPSIRAGSGRSPHRPLRPADMARRKPADSRSGCDRHDEQLRGVVRVALHAPARALVEAVDLRRVPPRGDEVRRSSGRGARRSARRRA